MNWITWVFSGVGVAVPLALIGWWFSRKSSDDQSGVNQHLKAGRNSTNVQAGRDATVNTLDKRNSEGEK